MLWCNICIHYCKKASSHHRGDAAALERSVPSGGGRRGESGSSTNRKKNLSGDWPPQAKQHLQETSRGACSRLSSADIGVSHQVCHLSASFRRILYFSKKKRTWDLDQMIWITYLTDKVISIFISDKHSHIRRDQPTGVNQDVSVPAVLEDYPPLRRSKQPRWQAFQEVNHPQKVTCQEPISAARSMYLCDKYYTPPLALCSSSVVDRNYSIYLREVFIGYFLLAFLLTVCVCFRKDHHTRITPPGKFSHILQEPEKHADKLRIHF